MSGRIAKRNNVIVSGEGDTALMFAHGYGCDQNMWRLVAPAFADRFQIILFDHVGSGNSDWSAYKPEKYSSLHGYSTDVLELIDELGLRDIIFVGHSVSSMIGMLAAIKEPSWFRAQIMIGPSPCYINHGDYIGGFRHEDIVALLDTLEANYYGWANAMTPVIMGNPDRPELAAELNDSFCRADPDIARRFAEVTFNSDHRGDLSRVRTHTLIMQCEQDVIAPKEVGIYMQKHIPKSKIAFLNATGHCPHLSAPIEVIDVISAYLSDTGIFNE